MRTLVAVTAFITSAGLSAGADATTPPSAAEDNAHIFTVGDPVIPAGATDDVEIVLEGPVGDVEVPIVIRNNTDETVGSIEVSGIARDATGAMTGTGISHHVFPDVLAPGGWAISYVYFEAELGPDVTFEFQLVSGDPSPGRIPLTITETQVGSTSYGQPALLGIAANEGDEPVSGPNTVMVACFDNESNLLAVESAFTDLDEVAPGAFTPFTAEFYTAETCDVQAVAAAGWAAF